MVVSRMFELLPPDSLTQTFKRPSVRPSVRPYGETKDQRTKRRKDYWTTDHGTTELRRQDQRQKSEVSHVWGSKRRRTGINGKLWEKVGISGKNWEIGIQEWEIVGKN